MFYLLGGILFLLSLKGQSFLLKESFSPSYLALTPISIISFGLIASESHFFFLFLLTLLLWQLTLMDLKCFSVYSLYLYLYFALSVYAFFSFELALALRLSALLLYGLGLLIYKKLRPEAIGEGDIFFIASSSLALGLYYMSILLAIATSSALIFLLLRKVFFKTSLNAPLAFFPFLSLGSYFSYLLFLKGSFLF